MRLPGWGVFLLPGDDVVYVKGWFVLMVTGCGVEWECGRKERLRNSNSSVFFLRWSTMYRALFGDETVKAIMKHRIEGTGIIVDRFGNVRIRNQSVG